MAAWSALYSSGQHIFAIAALIAGTNAAYYQTENKLNVVHTDVIWLKQSVTELSAADAKIIDDVAGLKKDVNDSFAALRKEKAEDIAGLKKDVNDGFAALRKENAARRWW